MTDCIFCKIIKGEIPCYPVYEDDDTIAFLDITQVVDGHTLLIPKKHVRWVWDLENIGKFYETAQKIVRHMQHVTGEEFVYSVTIGEMVPHAHLHLLPKTEGVLAGVLEKWSEALTLREKPPEEMLKIADRFVIPS